MSIRTTITLEENVMAALQAEAKRRGLTFKETVNETIRAGLRRQEQREIPPFRVKPLQMGGPLPGVNYDCTAELWDLDDKEIR
ncbi:MAG: hypothetical protein JST93_21300 [Acidobacteria bacterium]|nr:hypothetical protein [Acidobacteriota bacterium]